MSKSALSKEQEEDIQKLNQMSQQLRILQNQQGQLEGQKVEISRTLDILKDLPEGNEIYRQAGQILFKADIVATKDDLTEKLELLEIRVNQSTKQFNDYQKATQDLESKVRGYLKL